MGKKRPGLFIYDLKENTLSEVAGLPEGNFFPTFPVFDEHSKGIVFPAINTPMQKFGMNYCLNRDTKLYYIRDPVSDKKKVPAEGVYMQCLNPSEFMAVCPRFSEDFSKLMYFGTKDKFISHCGNY